MSSLSITIPARARSARGTFTLTPEIDGVGEGSESVVVSGTSDVTVTSAIVLIHEAPALSIGSAAASEADDTIRFPVRLEPPSDRRITVRYATSNNAPAPNVFPAIAGRDYTARSGTLTFEPGRTAATITVPLRHDVLDEEDEIFTVTLSSASGNTPIGLATATGIIEDDDTATGIALSVTPTAVTETGRAQTMTVTAAVTGTAARPTRTPRRSR